MNAKRNTKRRRRRREEGNSFSQQEVTGNLFDRSLSHVLPFVPPLAGSSWTNARSFVFTGFRRSAVAPRSLQLISIVPMINALAEISSWCVRSWNSIEPPFLSPFVRFTLRNRTAVGVWLSSQDDEIGNGNLKVISRTLLGFPERELKSVVYERDCLRRWVKIGTRIRNTFVQSFFFFLRHSCQFLRTKPRWRNHCVESRHFIYNFVNLHTHTSAAIK